MITEYFCLQLRQMLHAALPLHSMIEVLDLPLDRICVIPNVDPVLLGVLNWRGKLLWSVDLSNLLEVRAEETSAQKALTSNLTAVVIAQDNPNRQLACIVSSLKGVQEISGQQIRSLPANLPTAVHQYANGVVQLQLPPLPMLLLDPAAILNSPRWQHSSTPTQTI
jgi:chemotaxis signal transduction protein